MRDDIDEALLQRYCRRRRFGESQEEPGEEKLLWLA